MRQKSVTSESKESAFVEHIDSTRIDVAFDRMAQQCPNAIAVHDINGSYSYAEISSCVNDLAEQITESERIPEEAIAIWGGRSVEFVIAALAAMKAGCAYVPLDLKSPPERLLDVLSVSSPRVMIVCADEPVTVAIGKDNSKDIHLKTAARALKFCLMAVDIDRQLPSANVLSPSSDLAFLMFTSGSAGKSKGVLIEHHSVISLIGGIDYVDVGPGKTVLNLSRTSFDATTFEIWGALLRGATLAIYPENDLDFEELKEFLKRYRVDTAWLTAGLFHEIMAQDSSIIHTLYQLIVGGDVVSPLPFNAFLEARTGRRIVNGYGPTEATTFTTTFVATSPTTTKTIVPIGKPIQGARTYLLDASLKPVPRGIAGELHIAGAGLARGYIGGHRRNRDFSMLSCDGKMQRVYATGDVVREREDGQLEFLGREDEQVKIRGFRVELAEIERCLESLPTIDRAVVVACREEGMPTTLLTFVVGRDLAPNALGEMLSHTRKYLPDYMIPARWFVGDRIPLNNNGKVNRVALLENWGQELLTKVTDSMSDTERDISTIWKSVLRRPTLGSDDQFLDVGGNSILAVRIVAKLKDHFDVDLSVKDFNRCGTTRSLGHLIDAKLGATAEETDIA